MTLHSHSSDPTDQFCELRDDMGVLAQKVYGFRCIAGLDRRFAGALNRPSVPSLPPGPPRRLKEEANTLNRQPRTPSCRKRHDGSQIGPTEEPRMAS